MTASPMSADRINVTPGQLPPSLNFVHAAPALTSCVELGGDENANLWFTVTTPRPSTGEALLLDVLRWLNGQDTFPDEADLRSWLDVENLAAVAATAPMWVAS